MTSDARFRPHGVRRLLPECGAGRDRVPGYPRDELGSFHAGRTVTSRLTEVKRVLAGAISHEIGRLLAEHTGAGLAPAGLL